MALLKGKKLAQDTWQWLETAAVSPPSVLPADGDLIVPLAVWQAQREAFLARRGRVGLCLTGDDDPAAIAADLAHLQLIAVRFTSFTDGRGYSIARLLRERYGWRGELRAVGDVQRDQLFYLCRCGFDAFDLRSGEDVDAALSAFHDFGDTYQACVDQPLPLFRRREAAGARS